MDLTQVRLGAHRSCRDVFGYTEYAKREPKSAAFFVEMMKSLDTMALAADFEAISSVISTVSKVECLFSGMFLACAGSDPDVSLVRAAELYQVLGETDRSNLKRLVREVPDFINTESL